MTRLAGIVLAAGAGERMGGPKALLLVDGEPLARAHARRLREAGCDAVVVVTRAEVAPRLEGERLAISDAPDPAGSLAVGLRVLAPEGDDVLLVTPVDAMPVELATIRALVVAVRAGAEAVTPTHAGRGGHPVAIRARALAGFTDAPRPLRDVLAALGDRRTRLAVADARVALDLDTPDDVLRATGAPPRWAPRGD